MPISVQRAPVPPMSSPSRSGALRTALMELTPDSEEAVMLHPDEATGLTLDKLRNRASGIISNLRRHGYFYLTRTTQAKRVNPETGKAEGEPETCVGIWRLSTDPREGVAKPAKPAKSKVEAGSPEAGSSDADALNAETPDPGSKPASSKAASGAAGKTEPHPLEG